MFAITHLDVLLEVPRHIREGLMNGTLKAWGGTIRDQQGRIRALLVEGRGFGELVKSGTPLDPKLLTDAIGHAGTAAELASGLSALNLGVSIAGFAMIQRKLERLAEQLNLILIGMAELKEEARWINSVQMAQLRADVETACDIAVRAHRTNDLALFKDARTKAHNVRRALHHTMAIMVETQRTIARHAIFGEFAQATAVLAVVEARCDEATEGALRASETMRLAADDLSRLVRRFEVHVKDFRVGLEEKLRGGEETRQLLRSMTHEMPVLVRQMKGASQRLSFQAALNLSSSDWETWTAPQGSRLLTCVVPRDTERDIDLLEIARHQSA